MDITIIADLLQVALPTGLVVVGIWWALSEGWPYWKERDTLSSAREYEREMAHVAAQMETAKALVAFAAAVTEFKNVTLKLLD